MATRINTAQLQAQMRAAQQRARAAQQQAVRQLQSEIDRVNRQNQRAIDGHNRRVRERNAAVQRQLDAQNREIARANAHNARVNVQNRQADARNRATVTELNRRLRSAASPGPVYTSAERTLADRVQEHAAQFPDRAHDAFLSYAQIDGHEVGAALYAALTDVFGVDVWFDEVGIKPGISQSRQMDKGLASARSGIALLTPAYLAGRFWTERELGALLHKPMLIPVLHNVTFEQVAEYSGFLHDLSGFETARDSIEVIAEKIAAAVLRPDPTAVS